MGVVQFLRFTRSLPTDARPVNWNAGWAASLSSLLALLGVVLAVYLLVRSFQS
jgi:hypothetical protein